MTANKTLSWLKREFIEFLPTYCFFTIAAMILLLTETLILRQYGIYINKILHAFVIAIIYAKIILIIDNTKLSKKFSNRPLIYQTLWITLIYLGCGFLVKYFEHIIPLLWKYKNFLKANQVLWYHINWPNFCAVLLWSILLIFFFSAQRAIINHIGLEKFRKIFFGS